MNKLNEFSFLFFFFGLGTEWRRNLHALSQIEEEWEFFGGDIMAQNLDL